MLANAFTMSILTSVGFYMLYQKFPPKIQAWLIKYDLFTDFIAMVGTYLLFGGSVTALIAGAMVDIIISAMLHIKKHPEDFEWLFNIMTQLNDMWNQALVEIKKLAVSLNNKPAEVVIEA